MEIKLTALEKNILTTLKDGGFLHYQPHVIGRPTVTLFNKNREFRKVPLSKFDRLRGAKLIVLIAEGKHSWNGSDYGVAK